MLHIATSARVSPLADIEDSLRGSHIVIEDDVVIDAFVKLKPAGGNGDVRIGGGTVINSGCVLYTGNGIRIGRNVLIAANCTLAPTNHAFDDARTPIRAQGFAASRGGITIGDDVWIGANCVLIDGAVVGAGSVIGAASMVRGELPAFCIAFGVPARVRGWRGGGDIGTRVAPARLVTPTVLVTSISVSPVPPADAPAHATGRRFRRHGTNRGGDGEFGADDADWAGAC